MGELIISSEAEFDYAESLQWYAERSVRAAEGFEIEVEKAFDAIASDPIRYPKCGELHRYYMLKRYPFQIIYQMLSDGRILVVAVAHTNRRPNYWK